MNEIDFPRITEKDCNGLVLIAGGGKFTARFEKYEDAEKAQSKIIKMLSTRLPMMEFQTSSVVEAETFKKAQERRTSDSIYPGIIHELSEMKRCFRGYGISFNPHIAVCQECEEYPAVADMWTGDKRIRVCRICASAKKEADIDLNRLKFEDEQRLTSIERVYKHYIESEHINHYTDLSVPLNMEDMFENKDSEETKKQRIAIWSSDLNSMNDKVSLWLSVDEEEDILDIFKTVKDAMVEIISDALKAVFGKKAIVKTREGRSFLPFRIVVAGGDDLCIIMPDRYILPFAEKLASSLKTKLNSYGEESPLSKAWLENQAKKVIAIKAERGERPKGFNLTDYSLGGGFVVTSIHAPFTKVHSLCEDIMSEAKKKTKRRGNSIDWEILSVDARPLLEEFLKPEKPLFMEEPEDHKGLDGRITFEQYMGLCRSSELSNLSSSRIYQMIEKIIEFKGDSDRLEGWAMTLSDAAKKDNPLNFLLREELLRKNGNFSIPRFVTFAELFLLNKGE